MLGAVTVVSVEELRREARQVEMLAERARRLVDSGRETKFERLREVLEKPEHRNERWLIFSEHRDTVDYLVRRLEGLGYRGQTVQIHGGMDWKERDRQVEAFRRPDGARYMVATDAAGEGINPAVLPLDGELRHSVEPGPFGTADGPDPSLRPTVRSPDREPGSGQHARGKGAAGASGEARRDS